MGCDLPTVVTDVLTRNLFHISCGTLAIPVHPSSTSSGLDRQLLVPLAKMITVQVNFC